jgi:hypothetical protein
MMIAPSTRSRSAYLTGLSFVPPKLPGSRIACVADLSHLIAYVPSAMPAFGAKPKYVTIPPFGRMIPASSLSEASVAETRASARFDVTEP